MSKKLSGLGKGLGSLIPRKDKTKIDSTGYKKDSVFYVEISKIKPNPNQPRRDFDKNSLAELADSIKQYGVLQPLLVTKVEKSNPSGLQIDYQIIAGERRWRASQLANVSNVPVIVKDSIIKDKAKLEISLIENIQREDLNPMEEAIAYKRFVDEFKLGYPEIAKKVSKAEGTVKNIVRLLNLPSDIQESVRAGKIGRAQARNLLAFKNEDEQRRMYKEILSGRVSVKDVEKITKENTVNKVSVNDNKFSELENNLSKNIDAPVVIRSGSNGGKITIKFSDLEKLNKIVKTILG